MKLNKLYDVVDRDTNKSLIAEPTFDRELARNLKQSIKVNTPLLDPVIVSSTLEVVNRKVIR